LISLHVSEYSEVFCCLITVHVDKLTGMDCSYLCDILHYLLKERFGTPLVKLSVDLVDVDNKATLDLLCALFKHCKCHEEVVMLNSIRHMSHRKCV